MATIDRRQFLQGLAAAMAAGSLPAMYSARALAGSTAPDNFYDIPMSGDARILHITDVHGQLKPVYFREPNVNLGVGDAFGAHRTWWVRTSSKKWASQKTRLRPMPTPI